MSPIHVSPLLTLHLSPSLAGGIRLSGCLQFICLAFSHSCVSQFGRWCPGLWPSPCHLSLLIAIHFSPSLAGCLRLSGCLRSFVSPYSNSFVSQSGWRCPALRMSPSHLFPFIAIHLRDKWETSAKSCGPRRPEWETSVGDKWETSVNSCGVGDKVRETSGRQA